MGRKRTIARERRAAESGSDTGRHHGGFVSAFFVNCCQLKKVSVFEVLVERRERKKRHRATTGCCAARPSRVRATRVAPGGRGACWGS